jgi:hypothetical protein
VVGELTSSEEAAEARLHNALEQLQRSQFAEWAAIVENGHSLRSLEVVMRTVDAEGLTAGIGLRPSADSVEFVHHWLFIAARPVIYHSPP